LFKTGDLGYFRKEAPGVLVYAGRNDRQIKHNNYRVEPSEIESIFVQSQMVQDVCVLQVKASDTKSGPLLVACVLSQEDDMNKITDLREYGSKHLPAYMVPDQIISLKEFPLNSRGKIDYAALESEVSKKLSRNNTGTQSDARSMLEQIWRDVLGIHAAHEDDDFFDLGATSLQAAHLTVKIRQTFGNFISLQNLYDNSRFGETLQFIESAKHGEASEKIALTERLKTDSCLADDIPPSSGSTPAATGTEEVHIFLTGATGFLGSYFLKHLSCTVATKSRVTCLIRSRNNLSANARLREALGKYDLWDDKIEEHISVVDGDLATHHFGLADEEYNRLARSVSVIYHFGAHVNFCQPYQTHFEANVLGTKNILDFASIGLPKTIHYASTIDAWGATGLVNGTKSLLEDEALEPHIQGPLHDTGYSQSQWVAESLMRRARDRGFLVSIYRLGTVICDSERGAGNPNDFFARVAMGSAKVGFFPLIKDLRWEYVTVDYACAAIYHISRSSSNVGRSYSIVSPDPKQSVSLERTGRLLHEAGYPVKLVSYQKWVKAVSEDENLNDSPLLALMPLLREPVLGEFTRFETSQKTPIYRTDNTEEALADAADITYVPLSADMFRRMFRFWVNKGYYAA
jgi:thioester reductase-like protein